MKWLAAIVEGMLKALLAWAQAQREKPGTLTDAKTPESVKRDWDRYIAERLRDKNRDGH